MIAFSPRTHPLHETNWRKPLIYKPEANGYLLYSVGANGKDDGGRSFGDDPPGDDLVVRMPVPEQKVKK